MADYENKPRSEWLKADWVAFAQAEEEQIEELEIANDELSDEVDKLEEELARAEETIGLLQEQIATSEAVTGQPETYPELCEYVEALIGALVPLRTMMPRAIAPAIEALARSLRGRWPHENEIPKDRIRRVNELLEE